METKIKDTDVLHSMHEILFMADRCLWFEQTCCPNPDDRMWDSKNERWWALVDGNWVKAEAPKHMKE